MIIGVSTTTEADALGDEFGIAVLIPATDCPCEQVEAVRPQLAGDGCVVVVWNGHRPAASHDCSSRVLAEGAAVWLEVPERIGAAAARNRGVAWLGGRARLLMFVDADDLVHPDWLEHLREPLMSGSVNVVGGCQELESDGRAYTFTPGVDFWYRQALYGSSIALTRASWERLGGFHSDVGTCEDTDLAWRADEIGLRVELVPAALVRYRLREGRRAEWLQRVKWGRSSVALLRAHDLPLCRHLPTLRGLVGHRRSHGFAANPLVAGVAQYFGQCVGRLLDRRRPTHGTDV